jgi:hypothetical protein
MLARKRLDLSMAAVAAVTATALLAACNAYGAASVELSRESCGLRSDTHCWQSAVTIDQASELPPYFAGVTAKAGSRFTINDTIVVESVRGGAIEGNGAVLEWKGPPDRPLFLLINTQHLTIRNLHVLATSPLHTAIEFAKSRRSNPRRPHSVAPSANVIDAVSIEGIRLGNLRYGVRFSKRFGIDEDNDQSTILNTIIYNVSDAAISIEHSQSKAHRFLSVKATGAPGNSNAAFVRKDGGSFSSFGGFHGGFNGAVYDIATTYDTDLIVDENSEASAHLIRTPAGAASFAMPVYVLGGRFAVDKLAPNGRVIDFRRMGPLTVEGLRIDGAPPNNSASPVIWFHPDPVGGQLSGKLRVQSAAFLLPGSDSWDVVSVNENAQVTSSGNTCNDRRGQVSPCRTVAAGLYHLGHTSHSDLQTTVLARIAPGHATFCADCGSDKTNGRCTPQGDGRIARKLRSGWYCN